MGLSTKEDKLLNCPFCGDSMSIGKWLNHHTCNETQFFTKHDNNKKCPACFSTDYFYDIDERVTRAKKRKLIKQWNTRVN